jgi:GrpB-like predicted nucleotidyltransferase (UPF0157 family)
MFLEEHQDRWAAEFQDLSDVLARHLGQRAAAIHHMGSTSIPGMLSKPILDISIEMARDAKLQDVSAQLAALGYDFQGDKGIPDRYAYGRASDEVPLTTPKRRWMNHHLYVCPAGSIELSRSLHFRDSLVASAELRDEYRQIKLRCAQRAGADRKVYQAAKDELADAFFKRVYDMPPIALRPTMLAEKPDAPHNQRPHERRF